MLKTILIAILTFLASMVKRAATPKTGEAKKRSDIKQAGASKLQKQTKSVIIWAIALYLLMSAGGCNRTVYVPDSAAVRLRETVKRVDVWIWVDGAWEAGRMDLPEGWYVMPLTDDEINNAE
jgi:cadmium resistance protein CadD (predicted permease)